MESCKEHFDETHNCLICDMLEDEMNCGDRIIMENEDFVTFLPFFSEYPYGMYIAAKRHVQNLSQLTDSEKTNLAKILKETTGTFDSLFDYKFPYMMCMYQNPVNGEDVSDYYHFHIAFYPPMRSADKLNITHLLKQVLGLTVTQLLLKQWLLKLEPHTKSFLKK